MIASCAFAVCALLHGTGAFAQTDLIIYNNTTNCDFPVEVYACTSGCGGGTCTLEFSGTALASANLPITISAGLTVEKIYVYHFSGSFVLFTWDFSTGVWSPGLQANHNCCPGTHGTLIQGDGLENRIECRE